MKLILVRHTITPWNIEKRLQGQTDIELGQKGKEEAESLARSLEKEVVDRIYASDLKRAMQTAEIIARVKKLPVSKDVRLRECSFGSIEGHTIEEVVLRYGGDDYSHYDLKPYGGEDRTQVVRRHLSFLEETKERHDEETVLVVGHGRSLNTLLHELGHEPNLKRGEYRVVEC